jgi:ubiquitin fusion degradation protein 1
LERALLQHSCLTEGDWLEVGSAGQLYDLQVASLQPERAVSILETDVEAEIAPSLENEAEVAAAEEAARRKVDAEVQAELERKAEEALAAAKEAKEQEMRERVHPSPITISTFIHRTPCLGVRIRLLI